MYDTNLVDFYSRVAKFEKSRSKGYGHEAEGTLSRSVTYGLHKARRRVRLMPLVFVGLAAFGMKATILHHVGADAYASRIERLSAGEGFDRLGGWLMQVDPVTGFVAAKIADVTARLLG